VTAAAAVGRIRASLAARLLGLGSVFGKSIRDGRRTALLVAAIAGVLMWVGGAAIASEFATAASRSAVIRQMEALPVVLRGLLGEPLNIESLGGFLSWRYGNLIPVMVGIWSVLALSSTLAGEARRGTLDLVAAGPISRRRLAAEKALGHVTLVAAAMIVASLLTWVATIVFATLPGDALSLPVTLAHFALTGLLILAGGAASFAAAPLLGRGRALAVGLVVLLGGYLVESYASGAPILAALRPLSVFSWTVHHRPLADAYDWAPVGALALVVVALLTVGVLAFERRDIGITVGSGPIRLPSLPRGLGGPLARQLSDRAGAALAWGLGIGFYGFIVAVSADAMAAGLGQQPQIREMVAHIYPGLDFSQPSGWVQIAFFAFGTLMSGLAAAVMIAGWASDESERRLDVVLAAPLARITWAIKSGAGVIIATAGVAALTGASIAVGIIVEGGSLNGVLGGTAILALYSSAFAGIGLLVGGAIGTRYAAPAAGAVVIFSFLLELIGNALKLPDWMVELSLNHHVGQPMIGSYDLVGIVACATLALGGLLVGAVGWNRRDIGY
jgi:ABC-2 type transport system permease protein